VPGAPRSRQRRPPEVDRPPRERRPALWVVAWVVLPLLAGVVGLWISAPLAVAFEGPGHSWPGFAIAAGLVALAAVLAVRPFVVRLGRDRGLRPQAATTAAGWSVLLCIAAAAAGAAAGQGLDNVVLLVFALSATGAALLILLGLGTRARELYFAGMTLALGVLVLGAFVAVLALLRAGSCAVGECL
jgi:hypothetical protein